MIRARFKTDDDDPRPVTWPIALPYWITGYCGDDCETTIIVAYADNVDAIKTLWPEAWDIEHDQADKITFTDRFPKPDWFKDDPTDACDRLVEGVGK